MSKKIRTRFAPSPTGFLHVGGLRTAVYNYLHAKRNGGDFILRIEDTDKSREVEGAIELLKNSLAEFGLEPDEGPYIQSERLELYKEHAEKLIASKNAYYCFCSPERLTELREQQAANKLPPKYDKKCCNLSDEEIQEKLNNKETAVIRLNIPENETIEIDDLIRGKVSFSTNDTDDAVLIKSDGYPTYHLASVVDDHLMEISTVIRGEEWLPSIPKHIQLYKAFDWEPPQFAHMNLLLGQDKSKLSKRKGDVAVSDFLAKGYLKEALLNFLAIIGWTEAEGSEQELYSLKDLEKKFDLTRVNSSGAVFDLEKLDWINGQYIRELSEKEIVEKCIPFLNKYIKMDKEVLEKIILVEQPRLKKLSDISENIDFFFNIPDYDISLLLWKSLTEMEIKKNLEITLEFVTNLNDKRFNEVKKLESEIISWIKDNDYKTGDILWPLRVALSGQKTSPSPFEILWVIGKEESIKRIESAIAKL